MEFTVKDELVSAAAAEGYAGKMGFSTVEVSPGRAVVEMLPGEDDENIFGYIHGGALSALIDEAFQLACNSHGTIAVALNINVAFHSPAVKGVRLRAEARECYLGRRTGTYSIKVHDTHGKLIATCQATAYRKNTPLPFLSEHLKKAMK